MLLQFSVSNFRSFHQRQTLNLAASGSDDSLLENCFTQALPGVKPKRWLKGAAIYGANASGKTTVIEALKALAHLVINSAKMTDPKDPIPGIEPFALRRGEDVVPTAFEAVLLADGVRFAYRVAATRERIWHESLRAYPSAKGQLWFSRDWDAPTATYVWTPERPTGFTKDARLEGETLSNMLFLSKHIASNRKELEPVFRWFKEKLQFLHLSVDWSIGEDCTVQHLQEKSTLYDPILRLLRHADLGVADARVIEDSPPKEFLDAVKRMPADMQKQAQDRRWMTPELLHRGADGENFPLPWDAESAGTRRLLALAGPWLEILEKGHVICIDELETSMHPLMVRELLRLIFSVQENTGGAQLIFTTHNPLLLDTTFMRRDQVWFTDKDQAGEGHLYPLTDYAPRKDESLIRGYLSGRYGAVPFVPTGLLGSAPAYEVLPEEAGA